MYLFPLRKELKFVLTNIFHIDTDGNGHINDDDTLVILQIWGLEHEFNGDPIEEFGVTFLATSQISMRYLKGAIF